MSRRPAATHRPGVRARRLGSAAIQSGEADCGVECWNSSHCLACSLLRPARRSACRRARPKANVKDERRSGSVLGGHPEMPSPVRHGPVQRPGPAGGPTISASSCAACKAMEWLCILDSSVLLPHSFVRAGKDPVPARAFLRVPVVVPYESRAVRHASLCRLDSSINRAILPCRRHLQTPFVLAVRSCQRPRDPLSYRSCQLDARHQMSRFLSRFLTDERRRDVCSGSRPGRPDSSARWQPPAVDPVRSGRMGADGQARGRQFGLCRPL